MHDRYPVIMSIQTLPTGQINNEKGVSVSGVQSVARSNDKPNTVALNEV